MVNVKRKNEVRKENHKQKVTKGSNLCRVTRQRLSNMKHVKPNSCYCGETYT